MLTQSVRFNLVRKHNLKPCVTVSSRFAFSTETEADKKAIFDRKHIDFTKISYPEINPIDLHLPSFKGKE